MREWKTKDATCPMCRFTLTRKESVENRDLFEIINKNDFIDSLAVDMQRIMNKALRLLMECKDSTPK